MGQVGFRLVNVALFVLGCSLLANVFNQVGGAMLIPTEPPAIPTIVSRAGEHQSWSRRRVILERNLFNAEVVDEPIVIEVRDENIEETKLPLRLLGTVASDDQRIATAAIENTQRSEHVVVQVHDMLDGFSDVLVVRIERARIVLQNGDRREELTLDETTTSLASKPTPKRPRRSSRRQARSKSSKSPQERLQDLADSGGLRSPAAIFSQAKILPKYEDGEMVGIELTKIKPDSFYQRVGLQDGDTLMELNGIPINNPSASKELLEAFTSAPEISISGTHSDGEPFEMVFDQSQLADFEKFLGQ